MPANLPADIQKILWGDPWGRVYPPRPDPPPLVRDGRTVALELLKKYVCALTFFRPMAQGQPPEAFRIAPENFHIEWPDYTTDLVFPAVAIIPAKANYDVIGLVSYIEEESRDKYAPGTVVQWQLEYQETIQLEIWVAKKSERRSILAGLEVAMVPTEQMSGLRFRMVDYFDQHVTFTLMDRQLIDDVDSPKNRRRAQLGIQMRFTIVALVNCVPLTPTTTGNVDTDDDGNPVAIDVTIPDQG